MTGNCIGSCAGSFVFNNRRPQKSPEILFCFEHFNRVFHILGLIMPQNTQIILSETSVFQSFQLFSMRNFRIDIFGKRGFGLLPERKFRAAYCVLTADSVRTLRPETAAFCKKTAPDDKSGGNCFTFPAKCCILKGTSEQSAAAAEQNRSGAEGRRSADGVFFQ